MAPKSYAQLKQNHRIHPSCYRGKPIFSRRPVWGKIALKKFLSLRIGGTFQSRKQTFIRLGKSMKKNNKTGVSRFSGTSSNLKHNRPFWST